MSLLTDNFTLDLGEDSNLTLTKSIYNIQDPDKRQSSFTKTITVPSSANNDKIFASWFDVNFVLDNNNQFEPFFNPNKKAPCILHTDTISQMTGYAQLTDIVIVDNKVEYKLTLYGENRDLFGILTDRKMNELDLSEYNHTYNEATIEASWSNTSGYVYPMIDYGDNHIHWVNNQVNARDWWVTEHFKPWLFVKTLVDKIFQDAGFSYYSSFFNSDNFKKLIFQSDVDGLAKSDSEVEAMSVDAEVNTEVNISNVGPNRTGSYCYTNTAIVFDNELLDPLSQYDITTGITSVNTSGQYVVVYELNVRLTNNDVYSIPSGTNIKITFAGVKSNGDTIFTYNYNTILSSGLGPTNYLDFLVGFGPEISLLNTDDFKLVVRLTDTAGNIFYPPTNFEVKIKSGSTYSIYPVAQTIYGDTVNVSTLLNSEMTQKEFIMNLVKMFNLYIEPYYFRSGDDNSGKYAQYLIETRDEYFTDDVIDWTMNLDNAKDFVIKPSALIDSKFLHFTYAEDNDLFNDLYTNQTGRIYGDYLREIDNDFAKDTKKVEISFSPTIMSDSSQSDHWSRIMPVIKNQDGTLRKDGKAKILFYNGLRASSWNFNGTVKTSYPLASNVDDWDNPTTDLFFKQPKLIYYKGDSKGQVTFTNGTLFNKYYYRQIVETTDKNSKMIECYMRLRPSDVHNLSFRPLYFIRDAYYRLYEVVDHNYEDTTLCRFLKINEATPISNARTTTRGGKGVIIGTTEKTPTKYIPIDTGIGDKFRGGLKDVTSGGGVTGGGVIKEGFVVNVSGNNVLTGGLYSGEVIKDNIVALGFNYEAVASGDTYVTGMEGSPYYLLCDTTLGDINVHLPDNTIYKGNVIYIFKEPSANHVYIYDSTDTLFHTITSSGVTHKILYTENGLILLT